MFQSFFPRPKWFFLSALIWTLVAIAGWYGVVRELGVSIGFKPFPEGDQPIGLAHFFTPDFLWFYLYYAVFSVIFGVFWWIVGDNRKWQLWSVWGSQLIIFITYFSVQISVAINNWRRPFGDTLQAALQGEAGITAQDFYTLMLIFLQIAFLSVTLFIVTRFFVSHYIFRWRTAMNDYYTGMWERVRHIEGASQRVQEDTMRFASI
ncbi:MAG: SbmA/BacA-like family transporter, partial [Martelella sp.]